MNYQRWGSWSAPLKSTLLNVALNLRNRHSAGLPYCNGYARNCIIVDPAANVYFCEGDIGIPEKRAGFLTEQGELVLDNGSQYTPPPIPFHIRECMKCSMLPLCMGGCFNMPIESAESNGRCMMKHLFPTNLATALERGVEDPVGYAT